MVARPLWRGLLYRAAAPPDGRAGQGERGAAEVCQEVRRQNHRHERLALCGPGGLQRPRHPAVREHRREPEQTGLERRRVRWQGLSIWLPQRPVLLQNRTGDGRTLPRCARGPGQYQ